MKVRVVLSVMALFGVGHAALGVPRALGADVDCLIVPREVVAVAAPVAGLLEKVLVERGDLVTAGQVLATIESTVKQAEVAVIRARVEMDARIKGSEARRAFGERRLKRTEELFRQEMTSQREMDEAETSKVLAEMELLEALETRRLAELELQRLTTELNLRTVRSPITGVVMERFLSMGELANQNPLFKVAQLDPLRIEVFVPAATLGKIAAGMTAQVMPDSPLGGSYAARVTVVDRVGDPASGTFGVRLELPNPGYRLPAGVRCKVRFPR